MARWPMIVTVVPATCRSLPGAGTHWHFGFSQRPSERGHQYPPFQMRRLKEAICPGNGKMVALEGAWHIQAPSSRASPTP